MKIIRNIAGVLIVGGVSAFLIPAGNYSLPSHFPAPVYDLQTNPYTEEKFELGRTLFYDPILSGDGSVSCGSCHQQWAGFTNQDHTGSHGVRNQVGLRNALPLFNLIFYENFFWDGGVHNLDLTPLNAIENPIEMDESLDNILKKLNESEFYKTKFNEAFEVKEVTSKEFLQSLTLFIGSMVSANSRYDKYMTGQGESFRTDEIEGLKIVEQKCGSCHPAPLFTDNSFRNNGVPNSFRFDKGREEITLSADDRGKYRVPSLRNLEYTAPYMHDGSISTLEDVLDHYVLGMENHAALDPLFRNGNQSGIPLNELEKQKVLAFLKTLNDESFIKDLRFAEQ
jgi:cytochrome c peroxidase